METVTIPKEEYESLQEVAAKIKRIDRTIHQNPDIAELMRMQESQDSFEFLYDEQEDIYTEEDVKEKWNGEQ